jgi:hypothetical protein
MPRLPTVRARLPEPFNAASLTFRTGPTVSASHQQPFDDTYVPT